MKIENHYGRDYKISEECTFYSAETPDEVIRILEEARAKKTRLKIYYGDKVTGKDWLEESDTIGKIGRSTGRVKVPILLKHFNSAGGPEITTSTIVKIVTSPGKTLLWKHPNYHQAQLEIIPLSPVESSGRGSHYTHAVIADGEIYSRHESERSAMRLRTKLS